MVSIHIGTNALSVLIWIQTVCKGYQQTNGFDTHQDQCSVGSDLDPNCLQIKGYQQTNSLDPRQDKCCVGSDLDPNCFAKVISRQIV